MQRVAKKHLPTAIARTKQFKIVLGTRQRIAAGQEVKISYGNYSNLMLLLCYGFALPHNPYNYVTLELSLQQLLGPKPLQTFKPETVVRYKLKESRLDLVWLGHLRALRWSQHLPTAMFVPTDLSLELEALTAIEEVLQACIAGFPTSLEADLAAKDQPASFRQHYAVSFSLVDLPHLHEGDSAQTTGVLPTGYAARGGSTTARAASCGGRP